jgi:hypothetical protein
LDRTIKSVSELLQWRWSPFVGIVSASLLYVLIVIAVVPTEFPGTAKGSSRSVDRAEYPTDQVGEPSADDSPQQNVAAPRLTQPTLPRPMIPSGSRGFSPPLGSEPDEAPMVENIEAPEPPPEPSDNGVTIIGSRRLAPPVQPEAEGGDVDNPEAMDPAKVAEFAARARLRALVGSAGEPPEKEAQGMQQAEPNNAPEQSQGDVGSD